MQDCLLDHRPEQVIPLRLVVENNFSPWLEEQPESLRRWVISTGFKAKAGSICLVPNGEGGLAAVLLGVTTLDDLWVCGDLSKTLP